jgi:surface polysaccharide O-acyltransferase-like enzyme
LLPFIFWGSVYIAYQYRGSFVSGDFPKMTDVLHKIFFEDIYYHLWFIPMITGLYLLTPVFRIFISNARRSDVEYFLTLAFSITAIQHLVPGFFIAEYIGWLGYIGFYVLGYYLSAYTLSTRIRKWLYALGLAMPFVTATGTWWLSIRAGAHDHTLFNYFSPNVVLMTAALFTWLKEFDWPAFAARNPRLHALVHRVALLSFGVYFVHVLILDVLKNGYIGGWQVNADVYLNHPIHPLAGALLQALTVALISFSVIFLLSKIKGVQKWLM